MLRRSILSSMLIVAALLALTAPAFAGGWAVVTLDSLPTEIHAGQALHIGFVIRQHGQQPVNNDWDNHPLRPYLSATKREAGTATLFDRLTGTKAAYAAPSEKGETIRVEARQEGQVGHFVADVVLPSNGTWEWEIKAPPFEIAQKFDALTVLPALAGSEQASGAQAEAQASSAPRVEPATLRWIGALLLIIAAGMALVRQRAALGRWLAIRSQRTG